MGTLQKKNNSTKNAIPPLRKPDIFEYDDYRVFIQDQMKFLKNTRPHFTSQSLARTINVARSYVTMFVKGTRNFSEDTWDRFSRELYLSQTEIRILSLLRILAESHSLDRCLEALSQLQRFKQHCLAKDENLLVYQLFANWHYIAIREMTAIPEFRADPEWIQQKLKRKVSQNEIRKALAFLSEHNLIIISPDGHAKMRERL